ncbi:MAG: hypothetical protein AB7S26_33610 [Sandaracinaceae bacterium]
MLSPRTQRAVALAIALISAPLGARAQDAGPMECTDPTPRIEGVFPAHRAREVTVDAPLRVRYSPGHFEPGGPGGDPTELLTIRRCGDVGTCDLDTCAEPSEPVAGLVQILGDEIVFLPDGGWTPNATFTGVALNRFGDLAFTFCTGSSTDSSPPTLGALEEVTSDAIEPRCDAPDGGYRIGLFFQPATDDGPAGSIEYIVYQTRGPGIEGPIIRSRSRNTATTGQVALGFVLPRGEADSPICVRLAAVDGVGNVIYDEVTDGQARCIDPVQGNFFYGLCSVSATPGSGPGPLGWPLAIVAMALLLTARRSGSRRCGGPARGPRASTSPPR